MNAVAGLLQVWPAALLVAPLLAACLVYLAPRSGPLLGPLVCVVNAGTVGGLAWHVAITGPMHHAVGGWSAPLGIALRLDGLAAVMLAANAAVALAAAIYAGPYLLGRSDGETGQRFWPLWLFLLGALNALFVAADLFNLYVTLELSTLAAVGLAGLGGAAATAGAVRYLLVGLTGSLCYLLGVALIYAEHGGVDLSLLATATPGPGLAVALALMTAGLLVKAGSFPFHFWLPPAHSSAPAPVSAMLSALVVEAAFYLVVRLWTGLAPAPMAEAALLLLALLGGGAVLWGSVQALRAARLKLMIAYSTVAQLGYLFLVLPLLAGGRGAAGAWVGIALLVLAHALAKGAVFLAAGTILKVGGHDRIHDLEGLAQRLPLTVAAFILAGVSLIGLPPSGGFLGKWLLLNAAVGTGAWWVVAVLLVGSVLAGGYIFRVVGVAFAHAPDVRRQPLPAALEWPPFVLAALAVAVGFAGTGLAALAAAGSPFEGPLLQELAR